MKLIAGVDVEPLMRNVTVPTRYLTAAAGPDALTLYQTLLRCVYDLNQAEKALHSRVYGCCRRR